MLSRKEEALLSDLSISECWYVLVHLVLGCGYLWPHDIHDRSQDPWCEGMWDALKLPPGLPDPDVDLRYEAGAVTM